MQRRSMSKETTHSPDCIDAFLSSLIVGGRSQNTVRAYRADLAPIRAKLPDSFDRDCLENVCAEHLTVGRGEWKNSAARRKVTACRQLGAFLGYKDFLADYKQPPRPNHVAHPVPGLLDGVRELAEVAGRDSHRALVVLCGFLGLR